MAKVSNPLELSAGPSFISKGVTNNAQQWVHEPHNEQGSLLSIYRGVRGSKCFANLLTCIRMVSTRTQVFRHLAVVLEHDGCAGAVVVGGTMAGGTTWRAKGACWDGALASGLVCLPGNESLSGPCLCSRQGGLVGALDVFPARKACRGLVA